jgi:hypothetical protein
MYFGKPSTFIVTLSSGHPSAGYLQGILKMQTARTSKTFNPMYENANTSISQGHNLVMYCRGDVTFHGTAVIIGLPVCS